MRIPRGLLNQVAYVEAFTGTGALGPVYAAQVAVRCRIENKRRMVRSPEGTEVVSSTTLFCEPEETIPAQSKVTVDGRTTTVISSAAHHGLAEASHLEVSLI